MLIDIMSKSGHVDFDSGSTNGSAFMTLRKGGGAAHIGNPVYTYL